MWNDVYLVLPDEAAFLAVKEEIAFAAAVDVIGPLYRNDTGELCEGFHVNVRMDAGIELPAALTGYVIATPALPKRVFMAG